MYNFIQRRTPGVLQKLQDELDIAIPSGVEVPTYGIVKNLKYVNNIIRESLRIHSTSSLGLPRVVPSRDGIEILGKRFPPGTVLSVPSYTIHPSEEIWGSNADEFVPDRWNNLT